MSETVSRGRGVLSVLTLIVYYQNLYGGCDLKEVVFNVLCTSHHMYTFTRFVQVLSMYIDNLIPSDCRGFIEAVHPSFSI